LNALGIPALFAAIVAYIVKKFKAIQRAISALLSDRMYQGYRYYKSNDSVTLEEKRNFDDMYKQYSAINGDDNVMLSLHEKVMGMPLADDDHK